MKRIAWLLMLVLSASLLLCGCGAQEDPLAIHEFVIGNSAGAVEKRGSGKDAEYVICITLPLETDFQNCVANITLADGASINGDSPCLKADLGGRMVLDLTLEQRDLIIENGSSSRSYGFEIGLSR